MSENFHPSFFADNANFHLTGSESEKRVARLIKNYASDLLATNPKTVVLPKISAALEASDSRTATTNPVAILFFSELNLNILQTALVRYVSEYGHDITRQSDDEMQNIMRSVFEGNQEVSANTEKELIDAIIFLDGKVLEYATDAVTFNIEEYNRHLQNPPDRNPVPVFKLPKLETMKGEVPLRSPADIMTLNKKRK